MKVETYVNIKIDRLHSQMRNYYDSGYYAMLYVRSWKQYYTRIYQEEYAFLIVKGDK